MLNPLEWIRGLSTARHPETREILSGFEGVISPGEMLRELLSRLISEDYMVDPELLKWCLGARERDVAHSLKLLQIKRMSISLSLVNGTTIPSHLMTYVRDIAVMSHIVLKSK